jgi:AraC family transcriptional regulator of arabinose operon
MKLIPPAGRIVTGHFCRTVGYNVLRPGGSNDWLLIYTIRGAGEFGFGRAGKAEGYFVASAGDAILLRPSTLHDYRVYAPAKKWDLLWAHFHPRPDWQTWMDWPEVSPIAPGLMRLALESSADRQAVKRALQRMNDMALSRHALSTNMAMNALEDALLWCARQSFRGKSHDRRIEGAEEYLCQHLREKIGLADLAQVAGLSVSRLSHLFRKQTGLTPQQYFERQRLERARQLLELTSLPIKSIAADVGFANPFYFTLRFRRYVGTSPRMYRNHIMSTK